jgi:tetratricopeptide (TPR) repeat protein
MGMGSFDLGVALALKGRLDEAMAAFQVARDAGYDAPALYYHRGATLHGLKRFPEALEQFDEAMRRNPPAQLRLDILAHQGKTALAVGNTEAAVAALKAVLKDDPKHQEGRLALGYAYIRGLRFEEALAEFDVLEPIWRDSTVYYGRAVANYYLKRKAAALADIDAAIALGGTNPKLTKLRASIVAMP